MAIEAVGRAAPANRFAVSYTAYKVESASSSTTSEASSPTPRPHPQRKQALRRCPSLGCTNVSTTLEDASYVAHIFPPCIAITNHSTAATSLHTSTFPPYHTQPHTPLRAIASQGKAPRGLSGGTVHSQAATDHDSEKPIRRQDIEQRHIKSC